MGHKKIQKKKISKEEIEKRTQIETLKEFRRHKEIIIN